MGVSKYVFAAVTVIAAIALSTGVAVLAQTYIELTNFAPLKVWQYDSSSNLYLIFGTDTVEGTYHVVLYDASTNSILAILDVAITSATQLDYDMFNHYLFVFNPDTGNIDVYSVNASGFVYNASIAVPTGIAHDIYAVGTYSRLYVGDSQNHDAWIIAYNGTVLKAEDYCTDGVAIGIDYTRGYILWGEPGSSYYRLCLIKMPEVAIIRSMNPPENMHRFRAGVIDTSTGLWIAVRDDGTQIAFFDEANIGNPVFISTNITLSSTAWHGYLAAYGEYFFAGYDASGVKVFKVLYNGSSVSDVVLYAEFPDTSYPDLSVDPDGNLMVFYYDPYAARPAYQYVAAPYVATETATVTSTVTRIVYEYETETITSTVTTATGYETTDLMVVGLISLVIGLAIMGLIRR